MSEVKLTTNSQLLRRLDDSESNYDAQFRVVFRAIRQLMAHPASNKKPIGFRSKTLTKNHAALLRE